MLNAESKETEVRNNKRWYVAQIEQNTRIVYSFNLSFFIFILKLRSPERGAEWGPEEGLKGVVQILSTPPRAQLYERTYPFRELSTAAKL